MLGGTIVSKNTAIFMLRQCLIQIKDCDPCLITGDVSEEACVDLYVKRNNLVMDAVFFARIAGHKAGFAVHQPVEDLFDCTECDGCPYPDTEDEANLIGPKWDARFGVVAYIELPQGQVSWHLDSGDWQWDQHDDKLKYERIQEHLKAVSDYERGVQS